MQLPFRSQYLLAPTAIILLLSGLVAYTLFELPQIHRENEVTRQWEQATDRVQVLIAAANRLDRLAQGMGTPGKRDELLFDYIEQAQIYLDTVQNPDLLARAPEETRAMMQHSAAVLRDAEHVEPGVAHGALSALIPRLEQLYNGFLSQRRIAYMDYHRKLSVIISRLITASLAVLGLCIVLGVGLAVWGLRSTRRRLNALTQRAIKVCAGDLTAISSPRQASDELGRLDQCLAQMTQRLINVVAVEKMLQGAEEERRRIAMDMHDGILADLTSLSRALDRVAVDGSMLSAAELRTRIAELAESIRRVIDDLHPQSLEILGLEAALRSYLQRHGDGPRLPAYQFEFDPQVETALQPPQKIQLFRIVAEAIHNVLRHAQCTRYEVSLRMLDGRIVCTVEDNGIGMEAGGAARGHGCLNIAERARVIGARAAWGASRFSSGTRFELGLELGAASCSAC